jgi:hypothetical protein
VATAARSGNFRHRPYRGIGHLLGFYECTPTGHGSCAAYVLIVWCDRGPLPTNKGTPRSGRMWIAGGRHGPGLTGSELRFTQHSPPRSQLSSQFNIKLITHFIIDQYIQKLHQNSQLHTTKLNNYHVHFYSEIDSYLIFCP